MRGFDMDRHICIVEAGNLGGAGIFNGAMTSKTMWELARDYAIAAKVDRGYRTSGLSVDYTAVRDTIINAAKEKQYQILSQIETFSRKKSQSGSITLKRGYGRFVSSRILEITGPEGSEQIEADYFIIATGSHPRPYKNIPFDEKQIISSEGILGLRKFPKRLMVVGAGIIGCEFATMFSYFGQTKVHLLDRKSRIIPFEDEDLSSLISRNLKEKKVSIYHNAILRDIVKREGHLEVIIDYADGHSQVVEVDVALISIGRVPNSTGLHLDKAGLLTKPGHIIRVDENCRAKDNIFAVGDVTGRSALYSIAEMEGRHAVETIFTTPARPLNYANMSTIMFFRPEVAAVGLNEQNCRAKGIPYKVGFLSLDLVNRAIAMRNTNGFVKILVSQEERPRILGMRAAGPRASDLIIMIAIAMDQGSSLHDLMRTIHPHPAVSEALQGCLRMLLGHSIYKPEVFPDCMQIRTWKPEAGSQKS
jgi:dihydrolipoamide dehydrogenase